MNLFCRHVFRSNFLPREPRHSTARDVSKMQRRHLQNIRRSLRDKSWHNWPTPSVSDLVRAKSRQAQCDPDESRTKDANTELRGAGARAAWTHLAYVQFILIIHTVKIRARKS